MFDHVESLKQDFTDQYVVVKENIPELMRFEGHVGQVKTVNMNGRALVQFDAWNNIGWYDIDVALLKVVPKPEPQAEGAKHEAKAAPAKVAAKPAAAAGAKKMSPLEMARAQGAYKEGAAKPAGEKAPAAAKPAPAAAPGAKKSTADILAAARANKASAPAASAAPAVEEPAEAVEEPAAPAPVAAAAPKPAAAKPAFAPGQRPSIPEILAWCRQHDAK